MLSHLLIKIIGKQAMTRARIKIREQVDNTKEAKKVQLSKTEVLRVHLQCR
jgi:hypothetical protein